MSQFERVASLNELPPDGRLSVVVDDRMVLLVRVDDEILAIEDVCSHDGQPLTDGPVSEGAITCPRHGARFDLHTGKAICMPATESIATFTVKLENGDILVSTEPGTISSPATAASLPVHSHVSGECCGQQQGETTPDAAQCSTAASTGTAPDEAGLIEALKQVVDPELMINIVDLGLIYNVSLQGEQVDVDMTLTSPACPAGPQIMQQSKMALEKLPGVSTANIKLVMNPPWSPDRMTDDARDQLGIF